MISKYLNKSGKSSVKAYEILRICKTAIRHSETSSFFTSSIPSSSCATNGPLLAFKNNTP